MTAKTKRDGSVAGPTERCYMCQRLATSREHVPPRGLFPEGKDADGVDYRANLITVPSCDEHNQNKSGDDEFLLVSLAGIIGNNSIGYRHKLTKVDRAIRRSAARLLAEMFLSPPTRQVIDLGNNRFIDVLWGTPDQARLITCFDRIARGIYRHHHGQSFVGTTKPMLAFVSTKEPNVLNFRAFIADKAALELEGKARRGSNVGVFYYQWTDPDEYGLSLLHLVFYEGVKVYVALIPAGSEMPKNLGVELMNLGIPTILKSGTKHYPINMDGHEIDVEDDGALGRAIADVFREWRRGIEK